MTTIHIKNDSQITFPVEYQGSNVFHLEIRNQTDVFQTADKYGNILIEHYIQNNKDWVQISTRSYVINIDLPLRDIVALQRSAFERSSNLPEDIVSVIGSFLSGKPTYRIASQFNTTTIQVAEHFRHDVQWSFTEVPLEEVYKILLFFKKKGLIHNMDDNGELTLDPRFDLVL